METMDGKRKVNSGRGCPTRGNFSGSAHAKVEESGKKDPIRSLCSREKESPRDRLQGENRSCPKRFRGDDRYGKKAIKGSARFKKEDSCPVPPRPYLDAG